MALPGFVKESGYQLVLFVNNLNNYLNILILSINTLPLSECFKPSDNRSASAIELTSTPIILFCFSTKSELKNRIDTGESG